MSDHKIDGDNLPTEVILLETEKEFKKLQTKARELVELVDRYFVGVHFDRNGTSPIAIVKKSDELKEVLR